MLRKHVGFPLLRIPQLFRGWDSRFPEPQREEVRVLIVGWPPSSAGFLLQLSIQFLHQENEGVGSLPEQLLGAGMCRVWAGARYTAE